MTAESPSVPLQAVIPHGPASLRCVLNAVQEPLTEYRRNTHECLLKLFNHAFHNFLLTWIMMMLIMIMSSQFFFFYRLYNPGWVLICSTILLHSSLSSAFTLQPVILILFRSSSTWSIHLNLRLSTGLALYGIHSVIFLVVLVFSSSQLPQG